MQSFITYRHRRHPALRCADAYAACGSTGDSVDVQTDRGLCPAGPSLSVVTQRRVLHSRRQLPLSRNELHRSISQLRWMATIIGTVLSIRPGIERIREFFGVAVHALLRKSCHEHKPRPSISSSCHWGFIIDSIITLHPRSCFVHMLRGLYISVLWRMTFVCCMEAIPALVSTSSRQRCVGYIVPLRVPRPQPSECFWYVISFLTRLGMDVPPHRSNQQIFNLREV